MGSSFFQNPTDYQVVDEGGEGSGFYEGPAYTQIDPAAIANSVAAAAASASAAAASAAAAAASEAANEAALGDYAPLNSPALTGTPTAPLAPAADDSDQIATTSWVQANAPGTPPATVNPLMDGTAAVGVATKYAREDHRHPTDTSRAPLGSPAFTGTISLGGSALVAKSGGYTQFYNGSGSSVSLLLGSSDPANYYRNTVHYFQGIGGGAVWASVSATGFEFNVTPTAATAPQNSNSNRLATTAYVDRTTREKLTATRNYYVRTDGSDSNTGLSNTSGGAFLTIQKAMDVACALDLSIYSVWINVAAGTYNEKVVSRVVVGGGQIIIQGDTTTPSNVVVQSTTGFGCFDFNVPAHFVVRGFKLVASGSNAAGITVFNRAVVNFSQIEFGGTGTYFVWANSGGYCIGTGVNICSGPALYGFLGQQNTMFDTRGMTLNFTTAVSFGAAFMQMTHGSTALAGGMTFGNKAFATGKYYNVTANAVIDTSGSGATYFPGSVAGTSPTGLYL